MANAKELLRWDREEEEADTADVQDIELRDGAPPGCGAYGKTASPQSLVWGNR